MDKADPQMEYGGEARRSSFAESRVYGLQTPALAHLSSSTSSLPLNSSSKIRNSAPTSKDPPTSFTSTFTPRKSPPPNLTDHPHARQPPQIHHQSPSLSHSRGRSQTATIAAFGSGTASNDSDSKSTSGGAPFRDRSTSTSSSSPAAIRRSPRPGQDGVEDQNVVVGPSSSSSSSSGNISTSPTWKKLGRPSTSTNVNMATNPPSSPSRLSKTQTMSPKGPLSRLELERELKAAIRDRSTSTSTSTSLSPSSGGRGTRSVNSSPRTFSPATNTKDVKGKGRRSWTISGTSTGHVSLSAVLDEFGHSGGGGRDPEALPPLPPFPTPLLESTSGLEDTSDVHSVRSFSDDQHQSSHLHLVRDGLSTTTTATALGGTFSSLMDRGRDRDRVEQGFGFEGDEEGEGEPGGGEGEMRMRMGIGYALASSKRDREFHRVFDGLVDGGDYLIEDYSCAMQREILAHGRLYVSEMTVSFNANIFGWVTTVVIPFVDILSVEKRMTAFVIPNAILITTTTSEYFITSLLSRDTTFNLIQSVWRTQRPRSSSFNSGYSKPFSPSASNLSIPLSEEQEGGEIGSGSERLIEGEPGGKGDNVGRKAAAWKGRAKKKFAGRKSNLGVGDGDSSTHSPPTSLLEVGERKVGVGADAEVAGDANVTPDSDPTSESSSSSSAPSPDRSRGFQSQTGKTEGGDGVVNRGNGGEVESGKGSGAGGGNRSEGTGSESDRKKATPRGERRNGREKERGGGKSLEEKKSFLKPLVLSETPLSSTSPIPTSDGTSTICYCGRQGMHFPNVRMDKVFPGDMKKVCDLVLSGEFTVGLLESHGFGDIQISDWRHPTHGSDSPYLHRHMSCTRTSPPRPSNDMLPCFRRRETLAEALHTNFDDYVTVLLTDRFESVNGKGPGVDKIKIVGKSRICFMKAGGVGYGERTRIMITVGAESKGPEIDYYYDMSKAYYRAFQDYLSGRLREPEGHFERAPVPSGRPSDSAHSPGVARPEAFLARDGSGDGHDPVSFLAKTGGQAVGFIERLLEWIGPVLSGSMPAGTTNTSILLALLIGVLIVSNIWTTVFVTLHPVQPPFRESGATMEAGFILRPEEVATLVQTSLADYFGDPPKGKRFRGSSDLRSIRVDVMELDSLLGMVEDHVEDLQKRRRLGVVGAIGIR